MDWSVQWSLSLPTLGSPVLKPGLRKLLMLTIFWIPVMALPELFLALLQLFLLSGLLPACRDTPWIGSIIPVLLSAA